MYLIRILKEDWKIPLVFIIIFALCPWRFFDKPFLIMGASVASIFLFSKGRTWIMLVPFLYFLYPSQLETETSAMVKMVCRKAPAFIEYPLLLTFAFAIYKKQIRIYGKFLFPSALLILLGFSYSQYFDSTEDFVNTVFFLVNFVCVYLLIINSDISIRQFLNVLEVVFIALSTYAIMEFFFFITPYQDLYYIANNFVFINRASSLCGHPLILVGFICFYQVYLYARILIYGKMPYSSIFLLALVSILSASRTSYLIDAFMLVSYLYFTIRYQRGSKTTYSVLGLLIIASIAFYFFADQFASSLERFSNTSASTDNRSSAFIVSWNIFKDYPFGVGYQLKSIINGYTHYASGFTMNVLDNVFLALLCRYGVFMVIYISIFYKAFKMTFQKIKGDRIVRFIFTLNCINTLALSFSFIFIDYFHFVLFSSITLGFIYKLYDYRNNDGKSICVNVNL